MEYKVEIAKLVEAEIERRVAESSAIWSEYTDEIKIIQGLSKKQVNKILSMKDTIALKKRIEDLEISNAALIESTDYLRWELRKDDKEFYDQIEGVKVNVVEDGYSVYPGDVKITIDK